MHDLFLAEHFVRAPYHLLERYSAVKPALPSTTPPIKQHDEFPWRTTCVRGMHIYIFFSFFKPMLRNLRSQIILFVFQVTTLHIFVPIHRY